MSDWPAWTTWLLGVAGFAVGVVLVVWLSHRSLQASHRDGAGTTGGGDGFGGLAEVFAPGQARARDEIESAKHQAQQHPTAGDDPYRVDLDSGQIRIRRPD